MHSWVESGLPHFAAELMVCWHWFLLFKALAAVCRALVVACIWNTPLVAHAALLVVPPERVAARCLDNVCSAGLQAKDVDIIVTTCSIFCPTPSLASMVVNHFKMRPDVQSYHLGGMGCSNGVVAVNLIKDLLRVSGDTP